MKLAFVHDYLREYGGAERVMETLHEMWPEAPLYTSFVDWDALREHADRFRDWDIRTVKHSIIPGVTLVPGGLVVQDWILRKFHSPLRFLAPRVWSGFDLSDYDVVVSSSGWFMCRGVALNKRQATSNKQHVSVKSKNSKHNNPTHNSQLTTHNQTHICYIHHPPRNLYGYPTGSTLQKYWPVRVYAHIINFFLRHYDFRAAQAVDYFVANSRETARRVKKFYRRDSTVIYPPIEIITKHEARNSKQHLRSKRTISKHAKTNNEDRKTKNEYYLSVGRLSWAKRVDLAIEAANTMKFPLKVVGTGSEEKHLRSIAGPTVEFVGSVPDDALSTLYAGAKALIFCALEEDFGIVPVEAQAHGTPVIGLKQGGVKETVIDGKTGVLFDQPSIESLLAAVRRFEKKKIDWSAACTRHAVQFSSKRFEKKFLSFIASHASKEKIEDI